MKVNMTYRYCQPSPATFTMRPVQEFIWRHLSQGTIVDPFARNSDYAPRYSNDLNPETKARFHMHARDFIARLKADGVQADTVLFDPPYSVTKMKELYNSIGMHLDQGMNNWGELRRMITDITKLGGKVLSFGWNSIGQGSAAFRKDEILLLCHGGGHNDTICLAETKIQGTL